MRASSRTPLKKPAATPVEFIAVPSAALRATRSPSSAEGTSARLGLRLLYIALTRPTQRLRVLHSDPLPPGFTNIAAV